jgi:hypothetical protein
MNDYVGDILRHAQRKATFELIPFRDLRPSKERNYTVKGLIPKSGTVIVWGPPKCGKSFWAFDLMMHVALGWMYRGRRVVTGEVVYCPFEGAKGFNNRAEAFRRHHSEALRQYYEDNPGKDVPFYLLPSHAKLVRDHKALIAAISAKSVEPIAVVLDTLNRSIDGSESKDEDMGAYLSAAEAIQESFDCVVIIVHHCGVDGSRPRGHTSLTGNTETQIAVKKDDNKNVVVEVEYVKDGPEGDIFTSRLEAVEIGEDVDGDTMFSCVVVPVENAAPAPAIDFRKKISDVDAIALRALIEAVDEIGSVPPVSNHIPRQIKVVTFAQWRTYAYKMGISSGEQRAKEKAFAKATARLIRGGEVGAWNEQAWLVREAS